MGGESKVSISDIADASALNGTWRLIRKGLRSHTLRDFYLAQDPVQFAAYEWGLPPFLQRLVNDLHAATYSPEPADIFRGAKSTGLSRPLAFLAPRDALVYQAIVEHAEGDLRRDLRPWAGAEKAEKHVEVEVVDEDYVDWFALWLERQGIISTICDKNEFVVESDISNFFGSIDLAVLQEYLLHQTALHRDTVRLCVHIVKRVLRHPEYAESPALGLPQETFGSSRMIAHGMLSEVDRHFEIEGEDGIYSRFMDDFVTGVDEIVGGERFISRLQRRLERLGLYPNPAKTRVVPVAAFLRETMVEENAFLDRVEHEVKACEVGPLRSIEGLDHAVVAEALERAAAFRAMPRDEWPKRYDRVRRRYYTLLRRLGVDDWLQHACDDIAIHPDSSRQILEYVRSFPLRPSTVSGLFESLNSCRHCYDDVPLLEIETMSTAPNGLDWDPSAAVMSGARELAASISGEPRVPRSLADWILAYLVPLVGKYGNRAAQQAFIAEHIEPRPPQSVARLQAFPLQVSMGQLSADVFHSDLAGLPWSSVLTIDFVRAVEQGDTRALGVALSLFSPVVALVPNRHIVHTRPLMLAGLLARADAPKIASFATKAVDKLASNPARLRDARAISLLTELIP